ncbi:MAG: hypothetical protein KGD64_08395 [Candidatus Heimdallarchaeota archaeon]|nr:hypothetical protein [Candidatus Heimdallarchaeota archaeon]
MVVVTRDRYVVFQVFSDSDVPSLSHIKTKIWGEFQRLFGISGTTGAGLFFDHFEEQKSTGIIRCEHKALSKLMTILSLITDVEGRNIILIPLYVTGLINKAKSYLGAL